MTKIVVQTLALISMIGILTAGCKPSNQYQKQVAIPDGNWQSALVPEFEMNIADSTAKYDIYVLVRNDDAYTISNLWLKLYVLPPDAKEYRVYDRIEIVLADVKGNWLGRQFGNMYESKTPIALNDTTIFNKAGTYKIKMEQIMRTDPLYGIMNVGLNVVRK